jgi:glycosyltransferase involved in cell wall biosynthesis
MRIAQVVTYISSDGAFGGPVAAALAQSVELVRQGHSVELYAAWDGKAQVHAPGVRLRLFPVPAPRHGLAAILSLRLVAALRRERVSYDVVHLHFGRDLVSLSSWLAVAGRRTRLVLQPHGMVQPDARLKSRVVDAVVVRRALRTAHVVLTLTDREARDVRVVAGTPVRTASIGNGIPIDARVDLGRPAPPQALFLARLHPRKNVMLFAEAARRLHAAGTRAGFRVIGPDEGDLPRLRSFLAEHRLERVVEYAGVLGPGRSGDELRRAALLVLPSVGEVYPMTVLESMAVGTPVVLSTECGLSPALAGAGAAAVVPPEAAALAAAMDDLLGDAQKREALAEAGLTYARAVFAIGPVVTRLLQEYGAAGERVHA